MMNIKQNFEDQYFENFGFPMIICHSHPNNVYEFINLNNQNHNKLACASCIVKDRLNPEFLICIKDFFSKNPNNIIQNWPPLQDHSIYQQLISHSLQESKQIQSIEQLNKYFDKLRVEVLKEIDEHQKKILAHINSIEENRQKVINLYNEISNKDEIKNEFLKNKNNQQQLEQNLKQIISKKQTQDSDNRQNINKTFDRFLNSEKQFEFEFEYIQNVFKQVLMDLKQIEVLNRLQSEEQEFSVKISEKKKEEEKVQNLKMIEKKDDNQKKNEINEIDLLQSLQIIKSNYGEPDRISIKRIENNYFLIEKNKYSSDWSQVIIDRELKREKKYEIEIKIKENSYNNITVGLLPISQKDQDGCESKLSLDLYESGYGIDLIESGNHISQLGKDNVIQISFQICLKVKILRCLSVVDNVKNINSLDDWNKIQINQQYYFYIALFGDQQLHIKQFKIIKQFDKW